MRAPRSILIVIQKHTWITGKSGEVLLHMDDKQLQFLSGGDGRGVEELHILSWG